MINLCKCGCGKECKLNFVSGHNNRGVKFSTEHRSRMCHSMKGKNLGKPSPMKGRKQSLEALIKNSEWHKGKKASKETRAKQSKIQKGKKLGKDNPMYGKKGSLSPSWKGGILSEKLKIRHSIKYKKWVQDVFTRDDFTCQECGQRGGKLEAHHTKRFILILREIKENLPLLNLYDAAMIYSPLWDLNIGTTFCIKCHHKKGRHVE